MSNNEKLKEILALILEIDVHDINDSTSFDVIDSWDSMNHMSIILSIEEEFNIKIPDEAALDLTSYPLLLKLLKL
jgi:acyl carrier protein